MSNALEPAVYLVATPIGNARDITLRALDVLRDADLLVAEDTRVLRRLLEIHGIALRGRPVWAYHDHSGAKAVTGILDVVAGGQSVAYCSDAGTPLIADPGYEMVRAAADRGVAVTALPGPTSVAVALSLSGLPTDRFIFAGFVPKPGGERTRFLAELRDLQASVVVFETAKRIQTLLEDLRDQWGPDRRAALCRELTKKFEQTRRGTLAELAEANLTDPARGEIVLVLDRAAKTDTTDGDVNDLLTQALLNHSLRDAVDLVAGQVNRPRKEVYKLALAMNSGAKS